MSASQNLDVEALAKSLGATSAQVRPAPSATPAASNPSVNTGVNTQQPQTRPPELGPLTIREACILVAQTYRGVFSQLQYAVEPLVRDGSLIRFTSGGIELAQAQLRTLPELVLDENKNMFLPLLVYNVMYPSNPTPVTLQNAPAPGAPNGAPTTASASKSASGMEQID